MFTAVFIICLALIPVWVGLNISIFKTQEEIEDMLGDLTNDEEDYEAHHNV